tara:strand:+ start:1224 stop:1676 length:453 start_codon:yes stop_codon:yes gene_type:complete
MSVLEHNLDVTNTKADSQFPDEFGVLHFGPLAAAGVALDTNKIAALMVTDRDIYIDSVTARATTDSTDDTTFHLAYVPSGSAAAAANTVTVTGSLDSDMGDNTTVSAKGLSTSQDANKVPAGSLLVLEGAAAPAGIVNLVLTVRYHTRPF